MPEAVTNTSPLLYLHRIGTLSWLRELFSAIVVPSAVVRELQEGRERGYDVPDPADHGWLQATAYFADCRALLRCLGPYILL
jgi:predicted nucleic acid-binding protein